MVRRVAGAGAGGEPVGAARGAVRADRGGAQAVGVDGTGREPGPAGHAAPFASEETAAGCQTLVPGVQPLTLGDRLAVLVAAPLSPRRGQRAADHGLFDTHARNQLELF